MDCIIYPTDEGGVAVVLPVPGNGLSTAETAAAAVPAKVSSTMDGWGTTSNSNIKTNSSYRFTGKRDSNGNIGNSDSNSVAIFC